jgi:hypothetical protein
MIMDMRLTYRPGLALKCRFCDWRPADGTTVGVVAAHFDTEPEHGDGSIAFDLVVLCPRCDKPMAIDHTGPDRERYSCPAPCYRSRVITRRT